MKAIILAAGQGTRLSPYTDDRPKCLVPLKGRPLLDWQIDSLRKAGVADIVIVGGYRSDQLASYGLRMIVNHQFASTNMVHSLFSALTEFDDDLLVAYSDITYDASIISALINSTAEIGVAVDLHWKDLWDLRMEDPLSDAETLKFGEANKIIEIGKKPSSISDIEAQYIGLLTFKRAILPDIIKFYRQLDRNKMYDGKTFDKMFMTSFITELICAGYPVTGVLVNGGWCEVDTVDDLELYEHHVFSHLNGGI